LRGREEKLVHQDSQVKRENWAYQDLPAILVLRERKETRARKARMDTREKREIGVIREFQVSGEKQAQGVFADPEAEEDSREFQDLKVTLGSQDRQDRKERQDHKVLKDPEDFLDHKDLQEPTERMVYKDRLVKEDLRESQVQQGLPGRRALLDHQAPLVNLVL